MARAWGLGVVVDPLPEHERQAGRLSIPYITPDGVVDIKFRCIEDHDCRDYQEQMRQQTGNQNYKHAKYDNLPGSQARLFGVMNSRVESDTCAIVEGNPDTWVCSWMVGIPAFGIDGANKWRSHWALCFEGYERVFVFSHGDDAGKKMAENVKANLYNAIHKPLPPGEDIDSFVFKYGPDKFRERAGI